MIVRCSYQYNYQLNVEWILEETIGNRYGMDCETIENEMSTVSIEDLDMENGMLSKISDRSMEHVCTCANKDHR